MSFFVVELSLSLTLCFLFLALFRLDFFISFLIYFSFSILSLSLFVLFLSLIPFYLLFLLFFLRIFLSRFSISSSCRFFLSHSFFCFFRVFFRFHSFFLDLCVLRIFFFDNHALKTPVTLANHLTNKAFLSILLIIYILSELSAREWKTNCFVNSSVVNWVVHFV